MDPRQGFGKYTWEQPCESFVKGPSWAVEKARPIWDPQVRVFGLEYETGDVSKSRFVLHYNKDEKPNFEGVPLGRAFYGCDRTTGKLALMVLSHDLLTVPDLIRKTTAFLGPPTQTTMRHGDRLVFTSDGITQAGLGSERLRLGWRIKGCQEFVVDEVGRNPSISARALSQKILSQALRQEPYQRAYDDMCVVKKGPNHGPAPIPEEGKWVKARDIKDISGMHRY